MITKPYFGKYRDVSIFKVFNDLSEKSFCFTSENFPYLKIHELPIQINLLYRFLYLAESTSTSIRLLLSNYLVIPSLALIRIRLEQAIIFSYLINEDPSQGIERFLKFLPIKNNQFVKGVLNSSQLSEALKATFRKYGINDPIDQTTSEFTYKRSWTDLDLLSMAKKRDEFVNNDTLLKENKFETDYLAFYKMFSSLVHCDVSAITDSFIYLKQKEVESETYSMFFPDEYYFNMALVLVSRFDIIQNYEFCKFVNIDNVELTQKNLKKWQKNLHRVNE